MAYALAVVVLWVVPKSLVVLLKACLHLADLNIGYEQTVLLLGVLPVVLTSIGMSYLISSKLPKIWSRDSTQKGHSTLVIGIAFSAMILFGLLVPVGQSQPSMLTGLNMGVWETWLIVVYAAVGAPLIEEHIYRDLLVRLLPSMNKIVVLAMSAFVFSFMHVGASGRIGALVLGLVMSGVVLITGSIKLPIVIHVINNTLACIVAFIPDLSFIATVFTIGCIVICGYGIVRFVLNPVNITRAIWALVRRYS